MNLQLLGRGGISVAVLMFLGESTSIFQNGWYIARDLRRDSKVSLLPQCIITLVSSNGCCTARPA